MKKTREVTTAGRIRELREKLGLSQEVFAKKLSVSAITVSFWETGRRFPGGESLSRMSDLGSDLGLGLPWILHGNKEPDLQPIVADAIGKMKAELKIKPAERKPKRINRRDELPRYHISQTGKGLKTPQWLNLAAGNGCDLEKSEDYIYLEETNGKAGLHTAVVRGRSMEDTLIPGDVIVLEEFGGGPLHLHPRGDDPKNSYRVLSARLPQDSICVLSINDDAPTLKRVSYDFSRGVLDWRLMILAENMIEWTPRAVGRNDAVTFWAKMVGIIESPNLAGSI